MRILPKKGVLAITAIVQLAALPRNCAVPSSELAALLRLPHRHLEPILQRLTRAGIIVSRRGPQGGYSISPQREHLSAGDIWNAVLFEDNGGEYGPVQELERVMLKMINTAESALIETLSKIYIDDLVCAANKGTLLYSRDCVRT